MPLFKNMIMEETTLSGRLPEQNFKIEMGSSQIRKQKALDFIVYFFVLLFTYAGLRKLIDLEMFVREIWGFALFGSKKMVRLEIGLLSVVELIVALLLVIPRTKTLGIWGSFVLAVTINMIFFITQQFAHIIPWNYGQILPYVPFIVHFVFNIVIMFIALLAVLLNLQLQEKK